MRRRCSHDLQFVWRNVVRDRSLDRSGSIDQILKCSDDNSWLTLVDFAEDNYTREACLRIVRDGGVKKEYSYDSLACLPGAIGGCSACALFPRHLQWSAHLGAIHGLAFLTCK